MKSAVESQARKVGKKVLERGRNVRPPKPYHFQPRGLPFIVTILKDEDEDEDDVDEVSPPPSQPPFPPPKMSSTCR